MQSANCSSYFGKRETARYRRVQYRLQQDPIKTILCFCFRMHYVYHLKEAALQTEPLASTTNNLFDMKDTLYINFTIKSIGCLYEKRQNLFANRVIKSNTVTSVLVLTNKDRTHPTNRWYKSVSFLELYQDTEKCQYLQRLATVSAFQMRDCFAMNLTGIRSTPTLLPGRSTPHSSHSINCQVQCL